MLQSFTELVWSSEARTGGEEVCALALQWSLLQAKSCSQLHIIRLAHKLNSYTWGGPRAGPGPVEQGTNNLGAKNTL